MTYGRETNNMSVKAALVQITSMCSIRLRNRLQQGMICVAPVTNQNRVRVFDENGGGRGCDLTRIASTTDLQVDSMVRYGPYFSAPC